MLIYANNILMNNEFIYFFLLLLLVILFIFLISYLYTIYIDGGTGKVKSNFFFLFCPYQLTSLRKVCKEKPSRVFFCFFPISIFFRFSWFFFYYFSSVILFRTLLSTKPTIVSFYLHRVSTPSAQSSYPCRLRILHPPIPGSHGGSYGINKIGAHAPQLPLLLPFLPSLSF